MARYYYRSVWGTFLRWAGFFCGLFLALSALQWGVAAGLGPVLVVGGLVAAVSYVAGRMR
jgi:hypothetical protein